MSFLIKYKMILDQNKKNENTIARNNYIDFCRGIGAINIILIHTAYWSGESYVPMIIQSLALLLDVPFFFFLAGWGRYYSPTFFKTIKSLFDIYIKYVFFISLYFFTLFLWKEKSETGGFHNYLSYLSFINEKDTALMVIMGSIWFLPVFFAVVPLCMLVIQEINNCSDQEQRRKGINTFLIILLVLFIWAQMGQQYLFFSKEMLFYGFIFVLGYWSFDKEIRKKWIFVSLLTLFSVGSWTVSLMLGENIWNVQHLKFPPHILYLMLSMIVVVITMYYKNKFIPSEKNIFVWVGKNAIWYYFAQGVSSSLLFFVVNSFECVWLIKYFICIIINILLTTVIVYFLKLLFQLFVIMVRIIRKK